MKWLFLVNNASYLSEFFGKLSDEIIKQGDDCIVVFNSKIAEYGKKKFFNNKVRFISKIDWCIKNYDSSKKDFGELSWKNLFSGFDRFKSLNFNYKNSLKIMSHLFQLFEFIFTKEKPDIIISEPPAGPFHSVAYYFCEKNKIPYVGLSGSRFDDKIDVYDSEFDFSEYKKTFKEIEDADLSEKEKEFAKDFVEKFVSHKHIPSYVGMAKIRMSQFEILKHYFSRITEEAPLLKYLVRRRIFKSFDYESEARVKRTLLAFFRMEKRQLKIFLQRKVFSKDLNIKDSADFFFFPLHYQPEASTSVWATYYSDQLSTIRNIAFALPLPYKLFVKEHPASVGLRTNSFYKELKKIPNVVLVSPSENIEDIINRSSGVITLTSTAGIEAAFSGKPVYVLGNVFYSYHPLCRKVENFDELRIKIKEDLVDKPDTKDLNNINYRFIVSLFRNTIEGDIVQASREKDNNNYKLIYEKLVKIFFKKL